MHKFVVKYTLGFVILGIIALIIQGDFFTSNPAVIIAQLHGLGFILYSRFIFRKQQFNFSPTPGSGALIQDGPYRFVRHPIYTGVMIMVWASIFGHLTIINALIGVIVLAFTLIRISAEEQLLRDRYPEYTEYSRRTKKLIPFIY